MRHFLWILVCPIGVGLLLVFLYRGPLDWNTPVPKPPPPERAARRGVGNLWYDLIEDDPRLMPAFEMADLEARAEYMRKHKPGKGESIIIDRTKKRILKEKFGIDWRTVSDLNPNLIID
jgi:hypothetical protein